MCLEILKSATFLSMGYSNYYYIIYLDFFFLEFIDN